MTWHLAQFNIARLHRPIDDPANRGFVDNLAPINDQADEHPGFVWRLHDASGNSTAVDAYGDPLVIVNFAVWDSPQSLRDYTYSGDHLAIMRRRREWFERHATAYLVCWWIPAEHVPIVTEAVARLAHLQEHGPGPWAFGIRDDVAPPDGTGGWDVAPASDVA